MLGLVVFPRSSAHASSPPADSVHSCVVFDYEQWRREHPLPAAKFAADLNVGEPRTVRMIYFLPNDRPFRQEVIDSISVRIRQAQTFFVEQMESHGYGMGTLRIETDARGEPLVHQVVGQHPDSHYLDNTHVVYDEIDLIFDLQENIYLIVVDHSINAIGLGGGRRAGGTGGGYKKRGSALVPSSVIFITVAHVLGHAFGLLHDFRDNRYIMSYGGWRRNSLSACAAEFLAVNPYFNDESSLESDWERRPTAELVSSRTYVAGTRSAPIQLKVGGSYDLHQVILFAVTRDIDITAGVSEIKACRGLSGGRDAVVEFEYDGTIPSSFGSSLSDPVAHPIRIQVVNSEGDVGYTDFVLSEMSPHQIATLHGANSDVGSVVFSPNGAILATGSWDGMITVWHLESTTQIANLRGHTDGVNSVAFSPNGVILASGSWDRTIKVWDVAAKTNIATLEGHSDGVASVVFSPEGKMLVSGSNDETVKLWDVATKTDIATLEGHSDGVASVVFSPDGQLIASGGRTFDETVKLWDVATNTNIATLEGHTDGVASVAFSPPDGKMLVAGLGDAFFPSFFPELSENTVRLWDVTSGDRIASLEGYTETVHSVAFSPPDGKMIAAGVRLLSDYTVRLWNVASGDQIASLEGHTQAVHSLAFLSDGTRLASGSGTAIHLWDVAGGDRITSLEGFALSPDGTRRATLAWDSAIQDGVIHLWDVASGDQIASLEGHEGNVLLAFSPDGKVLASGSGDETIKLWDVPGGEPIAVLEGHTEGVGSVAFSPDGKVLASGSGDETIKLWDVPGGEPIAVLEGHTEGVSSVAFSSDGATLVSGASDGTVLIRDVETGDAAGVSGHGFLSTMALSSDGVTLALGYQNGTVGLWDAARMARIATLEGHTSGVGSMSFSCDGALLASGSWDRTVRLRDVEPREQIATLEGHTGWVHSVGFSRDGATLVSGASDGTMLLWDISPYIAPLTPNPDFDGDGTVGFSNFLLFASAFGRSQGHAGYDARYDLDEDGAIGFGDFLIFDGAFGKTTS